MDGLKDLHLLVWLTQLGMSVAAPMAGFTLVGVWLRKRLDGSVWIVLAAVAVGLIAAAESFITTLKTLEKQEKRKDTPTVTGYNEHK